MNGRTPKQLRAADGDAAHRIGRANAGADTASATVGQDFASATVGQDTASATADMADVSKGSPASIDSGVKPAAALPGVTSGEGTASSGVPTGEGTASLGDLTGDGAENVARGMEVYRENYCGMCHALDLVETKGVFGPTHNGMGAIALERISAPGYAGAATSAEDYLRESILDPAAFIVPGYERTRYHMPGYTNLGPDDVDALVQLLLSATSHPNHK